MRLHNKYGKSDDTYMRCILNWFVSLKQQKILFPKLFQNLLQTQKQMVRSSLHMGADTPAS